MQSQSQAYDVNLTALAVTGDALLGKLNQLREHDPVYWSEASRCWIVTGHAEVMAGFSGSLPLSSHALPDALYRVLPQAQLDARIPNTIHFMPRISTNLDGEIHAALRKLLVKAVNRKLIEDLRPYVRHRVSMLLDLAAARGQVEFHEEIARMLPGAVILRLLGMSPDYLGQLKGWADGVTRALTSFNPKVEWLDELEIVINDMLAMFRAQIEQRRSEPQVDLITQLMNTVEGGTRLSIDDILATLIQVIVAGHDTTTNSLTLGIRALASDPAAWQYWRTHPERSVECAIELMRYMAMSAALSRFASQDFVWRDKQVRRGDLVMLMIAGGNRDPQVFPDPERIDFGRANDTSLTFGPGLHHCIGHVLAKLQISEFFTALVQRFDRIEILEEPRFTPGLVFRSVSDLHVRFEPRPAI